MSSFVDPPVFICLVSSNDSFPCIVDRFTPLERTNFNSVNVKLTQLTQVKIVSHGKLSNWDKREETNCVMTLKNWTTQLYVFKYPSYRTTLIEDENNIGNDDKHIDFNTVTVGLPVLLFTDFA